jgi:hypothetical protein
VVTAVVGSVVAYFFCMISVFTAVMAFMTLMIGVFDNSTFEKLRHYPRPIIDPIVERSAPAPPNQEPDRIPNPEPHRILLALGTNDAPTLKDLSASDKSTKESRAASSAKANAENRKPERRIRPERLAHLREPKALAHQRQNYEGHGYAMTLGYTQGYNAGLDSQR